VNQIIKDCPDRVFIYGECYAILYLALYLKNAHKKVTVVTINKNILKTCNYFDLDCIQIEHINISYKHIFRFSKFMKNIKAIAKLINIQKGCLFIVDRGWIIEGFYLIRLLNKRKIPIYHANTLDFSIMKAKNRMLKPYITSRINKVLYRAFLGIDTELRYVGGHPVHFMTGKFYNDNKIIDTKIKVNDLKSCKIAKNRYIQLDQYDYMFVDIGTGKGLLENNHKNSLKTIIDIFGDDIVIKLHPNHYDDSKSKWGSTYPIFLPSDFLFDSVGKAVISIHSSTLIQASKHKNLMAIALLDIFNWKNHEYKTNVKNSLQRQSDGRIHFVKSVKELRELLNL